MVVLMLVWWCAVHVPSPPPALDTTACGASLLITRAREANCSLLQGRHVESLCKPHFENPRSFFLPVPRA